MEDRKKEFEYLFVFKNDGWWLKINTIDELLNYHEKTDSRWGEAFSSLINSKEFTKKGMEHASTLAIAIGMAGANRGLDPITATLNMKKRVIDSQTDCVLKGDSIYINRHGGWHPSKDKDCAQFYRKKKLVFPKFENKELRIKQFVGGEHYYAYIGDMQLRNGDQLKWNTYEDAYEYAQKFLKEGVDE